MIIRIQVNQRISLSLRLYILLRAEEYIIKECVHAFPYKELRRICYNYSLLYVDVPVLRIVREFFNTRILF